MITLKDFTNSIERFYNKSNKTYAIVKTVEYSHENFNNRILENNFIKEELLKRDLIIEIGQFGKRYFFFISHKNGKIEFICPNPDGILGFLAGFTYDEKYIDSKY